MPLIGLKEPAITGWNYLVKRGLDISISLLVLGAAAVPMSSSGTVMTRRMFRIAMARTWSSPSSSLASRVIVDVDV